MKSGKLNKFEVLNKNWAERFNTLQSLEQQITAAWEGGRDIGGLMARKAVALRHEQDAWKKLEDARAKIS